MILTVLSAFVATTLMPAGTPSGELVASRDGKVKLHVPTGWIVADTSRINFKADRKRFPAALVKSVDLAAADRTVAISLFDADSKRLGKQFGEYFNVVVIQSPQPSLQGIRDMIANKGLALDRVLPWKTPPNHEVFLISGSPSAAFYGSLRELPRPGNLRVTLDAVSLTSFRKHAGYIITFTTFPGRAKARLEFAKGIIKDILASTRS